LTNTDKLATDIWNLESKAIALRSFLLNFDVEDPSVKDMLELAKALLEEVQ
jgi:hypothetical protein